MVRARVMYPLGGLAAALLALLLWVSTVALESLDALVLGLFAIGLLLSLAGYVVSHDLTTRRLSVIGAGCNGMGAVMLAILYAAG